MDLSTAAMGIVERSKSAIPLCEYDYVDEATGLLFCGKCRTKKQTDVQFFGRVPCLCECGLLDRNRQEQERRAQNLSVWLERARKECFTDARLVNWNFANDNGDNAELTAKMQRYVDNFADMLAEGQGLLLWGTVGTGKTFAACEVANALLEKGYSALVTNFTEVINELQNSHDRQEYLEELNRHKLLVIDDLGAEWGSEYAKSQVYNLIDMRYRCGLPMVITTNLSLEQIKSAREFSDKRIFDRVLERCYPIEVVGASNRRKNIISNYQRMKKLIEG